MCQPQALERRTVCKVSSIVCIGIEKENTKAASWVCDMFAALAKRQLSGSEREMLKDTCPPSLVFYSITREDSDPRLTLTNQLGLIWNLQCLKLIHAPGQIHLLHAAEQRSNAELWLQWASHRASKRRGHWSSKQAGEWGRCLFQDPHYLIWSQREPLML